ISGAPRTRISLIARAASCTWPSRAMTSSWGSRVWSMISTVWPSAASQIVRIARPATFIAASLLQNAPGDRVEPGEEGGIAMVGRGDQRMLERVVAALRAWSGMTRQHGHRRLYQGSRALGIGVEHREDHLDCHVVMAGVPAIVVGHHRHRGVADLGFAGELGLGHVGHADHMAAPGAVELAFGHGRELRPLHDDVGAAALHGDAGSRARLGDGVADPTADRT